MRGLKIAAIVMASLLVVMVLMLAYLFLTAEVTVTVLGSQGVSAADRADDFAALKSSVDEGTFLGTLYQKPETWKEPSDYVYLTYTIHVRNGCLVPIDMIEVQVVPQPVDLLQIGEPRVHSLGAKSEGDLTATILAPSDTHPVREIIVSYYVWGVSFRVKTLK